MRPTRITPPAVQPVSLAEMKAHLLVEHLDEDTLIAGLLDAAVDHLDGWRGVLGRCVVSQVWEVSAPRFCAGGFRFPIPDVTAVEVSYDDEAGDAQTVPVGDLAVAADACGSYLRWRTGWSAPALRADGLADAVRYRFTCGLAATALEVPGPLKVAIAMLVAHWYERRSAVGIGGMEELPLSVRTLIGPYRVVRI